MQKELNGVVEQFAQKQTAVEYEERQLLELQQRTSELERAIVSAQVDVQFKEQQLSTIDTDVIAAENQMRDAAQLRSEVWAVARTTEEAERPGGLAAAHAAEYSIHGWASCVAQAVGVSAARSRATACRR